MLVPLVSIGVVPKKYNPDQTIILTGSIAALSAAAAFWECPSLVVPKDVNMTQEEFLGSLSLTPLSSALTAGTTSFQLAIAPNSLTPGMSTLFSLDQIIQTQSRRMR